MTAEKRSPQDHISEVELAYRQALEYGRDLARIYVAEKARREDLEVAHQLLSAVFASTPSGVAVLDDGFIIRQANPAFARLLGETTDSVIDLPLQHTKIAAQLLPVLGALSTDTAAITRTELLLAGPSPSFIQVSIARLRTPRQAGWVLALHDETEQRQARIALQEARDLLEKRVEERTAELVEANTQLRREVVEREHAEAAEREQRTLAEALADTAAALTSTLRPDEVLDRILANVGRVVPHDSAAILLIREPDTAYLARHRGYVQPGSLKALLSLQFTISATTSLRTMLETGQPLVIPDIQAFPGWIDREPTRWIRSYAGTPIFLEGERIGFLCLNSAVPGFYALAHTERLKVFTDQAALAIKNARLYEQAQELAVLEERQRIARDLHDAVSQTLWSASLLADTLPGLWEQDVVEGRQNVAQLKGLIRGALAEMRTLLLELRPERLVEKDLGQLLAQLGDSVASRTGLNLSVEIDGTATLPPDLHVALYRIAQEALNNVIRHAGASQVSIRLAHQPHCVTIHVQDDGLGFDPEAIPPGHLGIGIMRERAVAVGAELEITSQIGQGTQVAVLAPLRSDLGEDHD